MPTAVAVHFDASDAVLLSCRCCFGILLCYFHISTTIYDVAHETRILIPLGTYNRMPYPLSVRRRYSTSCMCGIRFTIYIFSFLDFLSVTFFSFAIHFCFSFFHSNSISYVNIWHFDEVGARLHSTHERQYQLYDVHSILHTDYYILCSMYKDDAMQRHIAHTCTLGTYGDWNWRRKGMKQAFSIPIEEENRRRITDTHFGDAVPFATLCISTRNVYYFESSHSVSSE